MTMIDPRAENGAVAKPLLPGNCWAQKRSYSGSLFAQFVGCSKSARKGHLTCHWHKDREHAAQSIKSKAESRR